MTPEQNLRRWIFRHDFMEQWLVLLLKDRERWTEDEARAHVQKRCEMAMRRRGYKYPFKPEDD